MRNLLLQYRFQILFAVVFALGVVSVSAQTPVPLEIDTNAIFTSANGWIDVFIPVFAISTGIAIALALLTFLGNQIVRAFKGSGR